MKETISARKIGDKWYDTFVREDESITIKEIPNLWTTWPEKYKRLQEARKK